MTRDDIVYLARHAHRKLVTEDYPGHIGKLDPWTMCLLERFAALVVAHEREASAKVCEEHWKHSGTAIECADAIRARGQE